jgi:hypothetical protein
MILHDYEANQGSMTLHGLAAAQCLDQLQCPATEHEPMSPESRMPLDDLIVAQHLELLARDACGDGEERLAQRV